MEFKRAFRGLGRQPGSSLTAVVVLGMGIGLSAFMFSVIFGMYYRGMGLPDEGRLHSVRAMSAQNDLDTGNLQAFLAAPLFEDLAGAETVGYDVTSANIVTDAGALRLSVAFLTPNAFSLFLPRPAMGRLPSPGETSAPGDTPVVISHRAWTHEFGSRPDIIGLQVWQDGVPMTVVGVMGEGFRFPQVQDAWIPLPRERFVSGETPSGRASVILKAREDVSPEQIDLQLAARGAAARSLDPSLPYDLTYRSESLVRRTTGDELFSVLMAMAAAVAMVLFVACANVANLLVARASRRTGEVGLCVALGGSRRRVVLPFLLEALLLAGAGALLGLLVAGWGVDLMDAATSSERTGRPYFMRFAIDGPVLLFTTLVAVTAALAAGVSPALKAAGIAPHSVLKSGGRGNASLGMGRLSHFLVVAEVTLSTAVLVGSGVTVRSMLNLNGFDIGFDPAPLMSARVALVGDRYGEDGERRAFVGRYLDRLRQRQDLGLVALASNLPALGTVDPLLEVEAAGYARREDRPRGSVLHVSPGFFHALGVDVLEGRDFGDGDVHGAEPVVLVDAPLAALAFPSGNAMGSRIRIFDEDAPEGPWYRIVGIVPDVTPQGLGPDADPGGIYFPLLAEAPAFVSVVAAGAAPDPRSALGGIQAALREVDPELPVYLADPLATRIDETIWFYRTFGSLFFYFGLAALAMMGLGLYSVLSFNVTRRRGELGVRLALGARGSTVVGMVSRLAVVQVGTGLALGLAFGWLAASALQALSFQVDPRDPWIFAGVVACIALVASAATVHPALKALRISPVQALRSE
jgi:predicted permease